MKTVTFSSSATSVGNEAFRDCDALETVVLKGNNLKVGNACFYDCNKLADVTIENSVVSIGNECFRNCDKISTITIPDSVTSIGADIFNDCDGLISVSLGTGLTSIPASAFIHCDKINNVAIPYRVTSIGNSAFKDCVSLTSIYIPRSVTSIGSAALNYPANTVIYGISGTYAETWADNNFFDFVDKQAAAETVSLNQTELQIIRGASARLIMSVAPAEFTDAVSWKSSDSSVVTIADDGTVRALKLGTANIKLLVGDKSAVCVVTVVQPVTSINLNTSSRSMNALEEYQLTASVYPNDANNKEIEWYSSNGSIASVDENGKITAFTKGEAYIYAKALDGSNVSASCKITVNNNGYRVADIDAFESSHNYPGNCNDVWEYSIPGAEHLYITFDARTMFEDGFDYLFAYNADGTLAGKYTGTELAEQTIETNGEKFTLRLVSDDAGSEWGFKVVSVKTTLCEHIIKKVEAKQATCAETGNNEYYICELCEKAFKDESALIPTTVEEEQIASPDHTPGEPVIENEVAASCKTEGSYDEVVYCAVCKNELSRETMIIEKQDNHIWDDGMITKDATCTAKGEITFTCTLCGATKTEEIKTADHTDSDADGKCDICGNNMVGVLCDHDYEISCVMPECKTAGYIMLKCKKCGRTSQTAIPALGHNYIDFVIEPTCSIDGYTRHFCARCGDEYADSTVTAKGHSFYEQTIKPTCTENGCNIHICSECGFNYFDEEVKALGHTVVTVEAVAPTCMSAGYSETEYCSVCNTVLVEGFVIPCIAHIDFDDDGVCDWCGNDIPECDCDCICHKAETAPETIKPIFRFFVKVYLFFCKTFDLPGKQYCKCGIAHW